MAYATVTLSGTYQTPDGTPHKGHVEIIPSERVIKDTTGDVILTGRVKVELDAQGAFSVALPATDDPTLNPTGFGYTIAAKLHSSHPPAVSFSLPASLGATTVEDLTPVDPATFAPTTTYAEKSEVTALDSRVTTVESDITTKADAADVPTTPADLGAEPAGLSTTTQTTLANTYAGQGKARGNGLRWLGKAADAIAAGTPTAVKWLAFGDSMAGMKINALKPHLLAMFGGYSGHVMDSFITKNATTGTVTENTTDYTNWVSGSTTAIAAGGSRTWGISGGSPTCDTIYVFYANNGGGTFKVQTNGTDEAGHTNVGTSGTGLGIITLNKTRGPYNVKVTALTGTVTVIGVGFIDSTTSGLVPIDVSWGGMELADGLTANAVTNLGDFLTTINPTVFTYEMRETDWAGLPPRLDTLLNTVTSNAPQTDLIGWGAPWDGRAGDPTNVAIQNSYVREAFEARGGAYWDGNTITPDHATIAALGWGADPIHPDQALSEFYAPLIIRDLGLDYEGMPSGKRVDTDRVTVTDEVRFAGKDRTAPEAVLKADATGNDLTFKGARWLRFFDSTGGTEYARLVMNLLTEGWLPPRMAMGQGNALLWGGDSNTLELRRNGSASNYANLRARALRQQWSILSVSGAVSVDFTNAGLQILTLTGNVTSMSFTGGSGFEEVEVHLIQDATGSRTLAGVGASIKWAGGVAPTLSTTPGRRDIFKFRYQSGSWWETSRNMNVG